MTTITKNEETEEVEWEEENNTTMVDMSCNQCQAMMISGFYCHEIGCPNTNKVKIDGEWVTPESDENDDFYDELFYEEENEF